MERFIDNGTMLRHIGETILKYLDQRSMVSCRRVSKSFKSLVDNCWSSPRFWLDSWILQERVEPSSKIFQQWDQLFISTFNEFHEQNVRTLIMEMQKIFENFQVPLQIPKLQTPIRMALKFQDKVLLEYLLYQHVNEFVSDNADLTPYTFVVNNLVRVLFLSTEEIIELLKQNIRSNDALNLLDMDTDALKLVLQYVIKNFPDTGQDYEVIYTRFFVIGVYFLHGKEVEEWTVNEIEARKNALALCSSMSATPGRALEAPKQRPCPYPVAVNIPMFVVV